MHWITDIEANWQGRWKIGQNGVRVLTLGRTLKRLPPPWYTGSSVENGMYVLTIRPQVKAQVKTM